MIAEKRTRSTSAPITSAPVIAAKLIWKAANTSSGIAFPLRCRPATALVSVRPAKPAFAEVRRSASCRR